MAKNYDISFASYGFSERRNKDNQPNKTGVLDIPSYNTDPANKKRGKLCLHSYVAKGESPNDGDVNALTPNGVSSSKGQGKNQQNNWWNSVDGHWGDNTGWDGGNLTGQ